MPSGMRRSTHLASFDMESGTSLAYPGDMGLDHNGPCHTFVEVSSCETVSDLVLLAFPSDPDIDQELVSSHETFLPFPL